MSRPVLLYLLSLATHLRFNHLALLLLTPEPMITGWLSQTGVYQETVSRFPSTIVKQKVTTRHREQIPANVSIPITILKAGMKILDPDIGPYEGRERPTVLRQLEIFSPTPPPGILTKEIVESELLAEPEKHFAFTPRVSNIEVITEVKRLIGSTMLEPDGGGINNHEGTTTLYFINRKIGGARLEIICPGIFTECTKCIIWSTLSAKTGNKSIPFVHLG